MLPYSLCSTSERPIACTLCGANPEMMAGGSGGAAVAAHRLHRLRRHVDPTAAPPPTTSAPPLVHEHAPWLFPRGTLAGAAAKLEAAVSTPASFSVTPLPASYGPEPAKIGAEVAGVDLRGRLQPGVTAALRAALLVHKVLVFKGQPLTHAQHVAVAEAFGSPTVGHVFLREPQYLVDGAPEVFQLSRQGVSQEVAAASIKKLMTQAGAAGGEPLPNGGSGRSWWHRRWHTDVTSAINPPWLSILRQGQTTPAAGVSRPSWSVHPEVERLHPSGAFPSCTHWVNLAAAYETLPPALKSRLRGRYGHHESAGNSGDKASEHPLVTLHPETGEHVLNISPLTLQHVVGMGAAEGEALLGEVTRHALGMGQRQLECMMRWALGAQDVIM
jgi:alpha-ketoglutarate-dependent taurine dioxygenase